MCILHSEHNRITCGDKYTKNSLQTDCVCCVICGRVFMAPTNINIFVIIYTVAIQTRLFRVHIINLSGQVCRH